MCQENPHKGRRRRLSGRAAGYGWAWVEETHLQGVTGEVGPAAETEFVHDARPVGLNGLDAQAQSGANFLVGIPLSQKVEHLLLTWTQELYWRPGGRCGAGFPVAEDLMSLTVAELYSHKGATLGDGADRGDQLAIEFRYGDLPRSAR